MGGERVLRRGVVGVRMPHAAHIPGPAVHRGMAAVPTRAHHLLRRIGGCRGGAHMRSVVSHQPLRRCGQDGWAADGHVLADIVLHPNVSLVGGGDLLERGCGPKARPRQRTGPLLAYNRCRHHHPTRDKPPLPPSGRVRPQPTYRRSAVSVLVRAQRAVCRGRPHHSLVPGPLRGALHLPRLPRPHNEDRPGYRPQDTRQPVPDLREIGFHHQAAHSAGPLSVGTSRQDQGRYR
mmetsp:Transcript_26098/g.74929  ORF Transcript_26098/g.74929 Transcript_26098/m.74929 type:complete len:234 (+) Transcript_26098:603-1304(+)